MNAPATKPPRTKAWRWIARLSTVAVSALILYYFIGRTDWEELMDAARRADLLPAMIGVVAPLVVFWLTDAGFTVKSFAWFHRPVSFWHFMPVKAAAYLLTMVNISAGAGGVFLYFLRKARITVKKQTGILAWRVFMAVTGYFMVYLGLTAAMFVFSPEVAAGMRMEAWLPIIILFLVVLYDWSAFWLWGGGLVTGRLPLDTASEFWTAFHQARPRHWAAGWAYTVPALCANFGGMYLVARSFNIDVPFLYFAFWIPLITMVAALPVAIGGLGTTTAAWMAFFSGMAEPSDIIAATIFIPGMRLAFRAMLGLLSMPFAMRELESITIDRGEEGDS